MTYANRTSTDIENTNVDAPKPGTAAAIWSDWRQHWRIGAATTLGLGVCVSVQPTIFSLFILPLQETFGWSRAQISLAQSATLVSAFAAPFIGRSMDRVGFRPFIIGAILLLVCMFLALASMPNQLWFFYLCYIGITVFGLPTSGFGFSRVIGGAFKRSTGFSLAVGRSGLALGALILPPSLFLVISNFGWRSAYVAMAIIILIVAFLPAWFWIRGEPGTRTRRDSHTAIPWLKLVTDKRVMVLSVATAFAYMPILAVTSQLQPLLVEKHYSPGAAASMIGLIGVSTFIGTIITGLLLDRFWAPLVAALMMIVAVAGLLILLVGDGSTPIAVIALLCLGFAHGAETDIVSYMILRYFGTKSFGSIYGVVIFFITTTASLGFYGIGLIRDVTGDYQLALLTGAIMLAVSACSYLLLGRYPKNTE